MTYETAPPRRRMSIRAPLTGLVLVLIVVLGTYYGWKAAFGQVETPVAQPTCTTTAPAGTSAASETAASTGSAVAPPPATATSSTPAFLQPSDVTVNVYNATTRRGLAINTAALLKARGFTIGAIDNDPLEETITDVAEIRAASVTQPEVLLLIQHVPGAVAVADDRTTDTVDLVLGAAFTGLGPVENVTPVPIATSRC